MLQHSWGLRWDLLSSFPDPRRKWECGRDDYSHCREPREAGLGGAACWGHSVQLFCHLWPLAWAWHPSGEGMVILCQVCWVLFLPDPVTQEITDHRVSQMVTSSHWAPVMSNYKSGVASWSWWLGRKLSREPGCWMWTIWGNYTGVSGCFDWDRGGLASSPSGLCGIPWPQTGWSALSKLGNRRSCDVQAFP